MDATVTQYVDNLIGERWNVKTAAKGTSDTQLFTKAQHRAEVLAVIAGIEALGYEIELVDP